MSGEAPGGEGKTCPVCGGLGWIPAGDEQLGCIDCNGTGRCDEQKLLDDAHRVPELESLLRSARLYFADGHPMRLAIERTLAERPAPSSARGAKGGAE